MQRNFLKSKTSDSQIRLLQDAWHTTDQNTYDEGLKFLIKGLDFPVDSLDDVIDKILKKIIGENINIDNPKIQEVIKEHKKKYNYRLKIMNGEFRSSIIELYNCLDVNTSETRNQERDMIEYYDSESDSDSE